MRELSENCTELYAASTDPFLDPSNTNESQSDAEKHTHAGAKDKDSRLRRSYCVV
jgi:hypothetical protein